MGTLLLVVGFVAFMSSVDCQTKPALSIRELLSAYQTLYERQFHEPLPDSQKDLLAGLPRFEGKINPSAPDDGSFQQDSAVKKVIEKGKLELSSEDVSSAASSSSEESRETTVPFAFPTTEVFTTRREPFTATTPFTAFPTTRFEMPVQTTVRPVGDFAMTTTAVKNSIPTDPTRRPLPLKSEEVGKESKKTEELKKEMVIVRGSTSPQRQVVTQKPTSPLPKKEVVAPTKAVLMKTVAAKPTPKGSEQSTMSTELPHIQKSAEAEKKPISAEKPVKVQKTGVVPPSSSSKESVKNSDTSTTTPSVKMATRPISGTPESTTQAPTKATRPAVVSSVVKEAVSRVTPSSTTASSSESPSSTRTVPTTTAGEDATPKVTRPTLPTPAAVPKKPEEAENSHAPENSSKPKTSEVADVPQTRPTRPIGRRVFHNRKPTPVPKHKFQKPSGNFSRQPATQAKSPTRQARPKFNLARQSSNLKVLNHIVVPRLPAVRQQRRQRVRTAGRRPLQQAARSPLQASPPPPAPAAAAQPAAVAAPAQTAAHKQSREVAKPPTLIVIMDGRMLELTPKQQRDISLVLRLGASRTFRDKMVILREDGIREVFINIYPVNYSLVIF
ncbi:hypothetical protein Q1695_011667 [Nippostrongylus brasiliensis]|nr:hypothetical protein Q1695_011667 [Nippostrongylus brasiliensis]